MARGRTRLVDAVGRDVALRPRLERLHSDVERAERHARREDHDRALRQHAVLGRLVPDVVRRLHDRLVVQLELLGLHRATQRALERQLLGGMRVHLGRVQLQQVGVNENCGTNGAMTGRPEEERRL